MLTKTFIDNAKVMSKGQVTIPKDIRDVLGINSGDRVTFVNDYGVAFPHHTVTRIMQRHENEWLYCSGRRYYIDSDCPWMPVEETNLRPA